MTNPPHNKNVDTTRPLKRDEDVSDLEGSTGSINESSMRSPEREQWSSPMDFVLSTVGFAVGLGNVWRFPYLCYKNGGGAFFIPYFISLVFAGVPVFFLEIALGQLMSKGAIGAWRIAPLFMGIGVCTTVVMFLMNSYYIVVLAWTLDFMAHSFTSVLPWSHCDNYWNTPRCRLSFGLDANETGLSNGNTTAVDPVVEFWENRILQISAGVDQPGGVVWELALALLVAWVLCYLCIWKGIKWTGKVVYFTATFPYVMLTVFCIRGVTLDGAVDGILFYMKPDFTRLADSQVWLDAGTQIFFSYAVAIGSLIALGSYNTFHHNCYRDCLLICCINCGTSVFAGFAIFPVLGFMAKEQNVSISEVAESGPGLTFIAIPKAVTQMPLSPLWAILFFFMILLVGLDSQFVSAEGIITVILDTFPTMRRHRAVMALVYSVVSFSLGLTMVTRGGMYVFQLFDYYSASGMVLLWISFFECITVAWIYGGHRFYDNIEMMVGFRINHLLRICWTYLTPSVTLGIFVFMWYQFHPLTYNRVYEYPPWAQGIGLSLGLISMINIPLFALWKLPTTPGTFKQRWLVLTTPVLLPDRIPDHWQDAGHLRRVGRQGAMIDDLKLMSCRGNSAYTNAPEEHNIRCINSKALVP